MGRKIITLNDYIRPIEVPAKLLSGRQLLDAPMHSPLTSEWYDEQIEYVLNGITINGKYWNPLIYHFMNFFYFPVQYYNPKTKKVEFKVEPALPAFCRIDEYVFDKMWEAMNNSQHIVLMGSRGIGKSYWATNIVNRKYGFFPGTTSVISASIKEHVETAWDKVRETLGAFEKKHPALKQKRITNSTDKIFSGEEITNETGKEIQGYQCTIEKILYGKNPNKTRSRRPDVQLIEEFGAFPSTGLGNLKDVLAQSRGSNLIGGEYMRNFVMMMGTGGSVKNDHAKEVFHKPEAYGFLAIDEWEGMHTGLFIPVHYKKFGTWEKAGVPDIELATKIEEKKRLHLKEQDDALSYQNHCQEYPFNLREVFLKKGTNRFNQDKIATQTVKMESAESPVKYKKGSFSYKKDKDSNIIGVEFTHDGFGPINMVEEVELGAGGKMYDDLYVMGVDSIDMGTNDSVTNEGSELAALVKKRIIEGKAMSSTRNIYVCWFNRRSPEVRDDYEQVLMMSLYYRAKINLEYTRINIIAYFREKKWHRMFMKRPSIALGGDGLKKSTLIGTQVNDTIIDHQDAKIVDYVNDYCDQIFIPPLLEQLRDYQREHRTPYDLVIAMGLCELADEEYIGLGAKLEQEYASTKMTKFGWYEDENGYQQYGAIPKSADLIKKHNPMETITWIDETGEGRFEDDYRFGFEKSEEELF